MSALFNTVMRRLRGFHDKFYCHMFMIHYLEVARKDFLVILQNLREMFLRYYIDGDVSRSKYSHTNVTRRDMSENKAHPYFGKISAKITSLSCEN